ncbi:MAG TPA: hypothetical protein VFH51_17290, partial [Myxococcota bacterium]|nr:hypothetical protein [Myxococcota bacterium]
MSADQKVAKILGVALDKRQIVVLVGALFAFWLLYKQLSRLLPMTTAQAFVAFAPLALLAIVVAFVTHDGRHVDWWVLKKTENRMKPRVLKWIKKHPGGKNKKTLRESIQEALPSERILWEMLRTDDGRYLIAFEARPVSLSLAGDTERERIWAAMAQLYNRIHFPIIEMTRSREGNVKSYTRSLRDHVKRHVSDEEGELAAYARGHLDFLEDLVRMYNVYERRGYIILPYTPSARERGGARTRPARSRRATKKRHRSRKDASAS